MLNVKLLCQIISSQCGDPIRQTFRRHPEIDDEWLPHVTLGKLQASKAQLGNVSCKALEPFAPKMPIMVNGLMLLGMRPKQLWLDWATWPWMICFDNRVL